MDKRKLKQYDVKLSEQRNALLGMVERTEDYGREADRDVSQDPVDKASNSYTKELLFSQSTNERNTLKLIEEALDRLAEGTFGDCINCGEPAASIANALTVAGETVRFSAAKPFSAILVNSASSQ